MSCDFSHFTGGSLCALALVALLAAALANQASADSSELGADGLTPNSANQGGSVLQTAIDTLAVALRCHDAAHTSGGEPALLVHGGSLTGSESAAGRCVPVAWQLSIGSNLLKALNADDETPGNVSYTSIYSVTFTDGGVLPQLPKSISEQGDGAINMPIQNICPVRVVCHIQALADAGRTPLFSTPSPILGQPTLRHPLYLLLRNRLPRRPS